MNRIYTFRNIITEYTEISKPDQRSGRTTAITNIMLHPVNDKAILDDLFKIYKAYTGMTDEKAISNKFFKQIHNEKNNFNGFYKLKVRRSMSIKNGKLSPWNIKGEFEQSVIDNSVMVVNGKKTKVKPNYCLFLQDSSKHGKTECYTDRIGMFDDINKIMTADVQVVVESFGKNGIQLTLFKFRKIQEVLMDSSNYKENDEKPTEYNDGLDSLFTIDDKDFNNDVENLSENDIEIDDELTVW